MTTELTREQIEAMPAGAELDELIGQRVMGWPACNPESTEYVGCWHQRGAPKFSTEIAAAWKVGEKMGEIVDRQKQSHRLNFLSIECLGLYSGYAAAFDSDTDGERAWFEQGNIKNYIAAQAETAPLAICRASLIAIMWSENNGWLKNQPQSRPYSPKQSLLSGILLTLNPTPLGAYDVKCFETRDDGAGVC